MNRSAFTIAPQMSLFLVTCTLFFNICTATKHSFITRNDARHLIGPIGGPFGFITGGVYNLTVYDFGLSLGKHTSKRHSFNINALQYFEAGFILLRFDSESDYSKYVNNIMEHEPPLCVYESHRHHDYVSVDPANYDDDQLQADDEFQINYDGDGNHHLENVDSSGVFLSMNQPEKSWSPQSATVTHSFTASEEGLYFLIFQLCSRDSEHNDVEIRTSFELDLHYMNYDSFGNRSYLTAGEMKLPIMYIYFSFSYALMFFFWASNIRNIRRGRDHIWASREGEITRPVVYAIHHLMTLLLGLKTITVFFEALRYYFIRIHGHAEFLSTVYYGMSFIKGIFMFTVILLIGSGWSLVKPVLGDREKKIIWAVLILQVIDNIAVAVLSQETEGEKLYDDWSAILHFVDILCCTAILVPIVWQVNSLEAIVQSKAENPGNEVSGDESKPSVITDIESEVPASAETARTLQKLKQFQRFYMLVVAYIYFTRIVVYLFATMLGYRLTWLRYFVTELGTLVFYSVVGILFRPMIDNPYLEVSGTNNEEDMIEIART